jgi:hypothetical protein
MAAPIAGMAQDAKQAGNAVPKADSPRVGYGWKADLQPATLTAGGLRDLDAADRALLIDQGHPLEATSDERMPPFPCAGGGLNCFRRTTREPCRTDRRQCVFRWHSRLYNPGNLNLDLVLGLRGATRDDRQ